MAFQIVELAVDAGDNVIDRKVVPHPFATRTEAATQIENVIAGRKTWMPGTRPGITGCF
jgi:hypothetical protein